MRCWALCVLLLAISESILIHAKIVLIVPRQVRRSPATPWRPSSLHYKKASYGDKDFYRPAYYGQTNRYYSKKPFRPLPYPHGGDDFDQGHEAVNHVHVPYGKDVSHGISFGKGYIPYENMKNSNLPFVQDRYAGTYTRQPAIPDYPAADFTSVGQEYATSATSHTYDNPHIDSFFSDMESATRTEVQNLKDANNKYYVARSIEKDLSLRNQQAVSSAIERDKDVLAKNAEISKDIPAAAYHHAGVQGAVILPAGIPAATIAGNKDGIVLKDTVSLDEYHKKLEELTKSWPSVLTAGATPNIAAHQQVHTVDRFPTSGLPDATFAGTGIGPWLSSFAQSKQGYAVREDQLDLGSHDFRTMPIHAASFQALPLGVNVGGQVAAPNIHG